ncbi:helix-turn-helix transcriptional regulator [Nesterenkonia sphaerica]|nr:helix-turn-helix transcriptional regulator [Nesterenkonia sphaerica]
MSYATKLDQAFPEKLKLRRQHLGMSQQKLSDTLKADDVHLSKHAIAQIEVGKRAVKVGEAFMIAQALETDLDGLLRTPSPLSQVEERGWDTFAPWQSAHRSGTKLLETISEFHEVLPSIDEHVMGAEVAGRYRAALADVNDRTGPVKAAMYALCEWAFQRHGLHKYLPPGATEDAAELAGSSGDTLEDHLIPDDKVHAVLRYAQRNPEDVKSHWWGSDLLRLHEAHGNLPTFAGEEPSASAGATDG